MKKKEWITPSLRPKWNYNNKPTIIHTKNGRKMWQGQNIGNWLCKQTKLWLWNKETWLPWNTVNPRAAMKLDK